MWNIEIKISDVFCTNIISFLCSVDVLKIKDTAPKSGASFQSKTKNCQMLSVVFWKKGSFLVIQ